ncbi:MAG: aminotransferase class V-fold PLP-dependent enzyme [Oscillibacter sp.]
MIYLDNAATTRPKPPGVAAAVTAALDGFGNCGRGAHNEALSAARMVYGTRVKLARQFACQRPDHVCFTANSTQALNMAIGGLFGPGDHILSTTWEHNSVLRPLYRLASQGGAVDFLPADRQGKLEYGALERLLRRETKAIVCTHASNLTGDAVDLPRISAFAKAHGLLLVVDASQTAGLFPIDMEKDGIDVLCFTGHKGLYGPQGTGGLCVGEGVEIRPFLVGGTGVGSFSETQPMDYPTRLEAGTLNSHGLAGLSAALDWLAEIGVDTIRDHDLALARRFYREVKAIPGVTIYGDWTQALRAPIVALNVDGWDSALAADALAERFGIAVRPGAHCAPRLHRALGTEAGGAIRFSWSYFNTEAETDAALSAVKILAGEGR